MRDREKSLKRVLAVQQQMVRLAEWRLGLLKQQCVELKADQVRLNAFVSTGDNLSPLLSTAAFKTGQALTGSIAQREAQTHAQSRHTDTMRRREKLAETLVQKVSAAADQAAEKRRLEETIQASSQQAQDSDDASFP